MRIASRCVSGILSKQEAKTTAASSRIKRWLGDEDSDGIKSSIPNELPPDSEATRSTTSLRADRF